MLLWSPLGNLESIANCLGGHFGFLQFLFKVFCEPFPGCFGVTEGTCVPFAMLLWRSFGAWVNSQMFWRLHFFNSRLIFFGTTLVGCFRITQGTYMYHISCFYPRIHFVFISNYSIPLTAVLSGSPQCWHRYNHNLYYNYTCITTKPKKCCFSDLGAVNVIVFKSNQNVFV